MLGFVVSAHQSAGGAVPVADAAVVLFCCAPQVVITTDNLSHTIQKQNPKLKIHNPLK